MLHGALVVATTLPVLLRAVAEVVVVASFFVFFAAGSLEPALATAGFSRF
jgi:hypothetical protein